MKRLLPFAFVLVSLTSFGQFTKPQLYTKIDAMSSYQVGYMKALCDSIVKSMQLQLVSGSSIKTINGTSLLGSGDVAVQATLVSGTNIKTVNSTTLLGSGDVAVQPTLVSGTNIKTVNSTSLLGSGDLSVGTLTGSLSANRVPYATSSTALANGLYIVPGNGSTTTQLGINAAPFYGFDLKGATTTLATASIHQTSNFNAILKLHRSGATPGVWNFILPTGSTSLIIQDTTTTRATLSTAGLWTVAGLTSAANSTTLADQTPHLNFTGTMPATLTGTTNAASFTYASAGSSSFSNRAFLVNYTSGYTGSSQTGAIIAANSVAGTGATLIPSAGGNTVTLNFGSAASTTATTVGTNVGAIGQAQGGNVSVGMLGLAQVVKNSATNFGGVFSAINTGTSAPEVALWASFNQTTLPTSSVVARFDNGSEASPIFEAADNNSAVFTIADGGAVTATSTLSASSLTATGLSTNQVVTTTTGGLLTSSATLGTTNGGTGFASYAVGDLLSANTTTTLSKIAAVAAGSFLRSAGTSTLPAYSTLILPNAATANRVAYATSTNTWGESAGLTFDGTTLATTTAFNVGGNATQAGRALFLEDTDNGSNGVTLAGPNSLTADYTITFPTAVAAVAGAVVTSTTGGQLSFTTVVPIANGGTGSASGLPISSLIAATGSNTINNANLSQTWGWNTWDGNNPAFTVSSTSTAIAGGSSLASFSLSGAQNTHVASTLLASSTRTGTGVQNVAAKFTASGGDLNNIAAWVTAGDILVSSTTDIIDENARNILRFTATASAVNELTVANAAVGNSPTISATGTSSNIDINLVPKGTGSVVVDNVLTVENARMHTTGATSNVFVGNAAGNFTVTGTQNTSLGTNTLTLLSSGTRNIGIGHNALQTLSTTNDNVAVGYAALGAIDTGTGRNVAVGSNAGTSTTSSGVSNTFLGHSAATAHTTGDFNIAIGSTIELPSNTADGQLSIQNAIFGTSNTSTGTTVSTGNIGIYVAAPTARLTLPAGGTGAAPFRITAGVAPSSPNDGDLWYEDTSDRLMFRKAASVEILGVSAVQSISPTAQNRIFTIVYNGTTYYLTGKTTAD